MSEWQETHNPLLGPAEPRPTLTERIIRLAQSAETTLDSAVRHGGMILHHAVELVKGA